MLRSKTTRKIVFALISTIIISNVNGEYDSGTKKNITCEKIQHSEFPEDLFTLTQKKCGAIILHFVFAVHCFGAIAVVCSERFLPTINCICEDLKLSDDVAAATFMSIATSVPELFSNIIGTFITESDIGIGHVIGNGYYNMFFVAAVGGLVATKEITLEWWPLARDCSIYTLVASVLTGTVWDGIIQLHEAVVLLLLYFIYFFIMFNNKKIMKFVYLKFRTKILNASQSEVTETHSKDTENKKGLHEKGNLEELEPIDSENDFTLPPPPRPTSKAENERWNRTKKIVLIPINFLIRFTIPDVRINKYRKYYPVTFVVCVAWIGISTYLGTWMVSLIGKTIGVPDLIMGIAFMAAGGSVVETYAVYYKARRGECSIGLSNSIGCNNLDVTLCLALPWLIKTLPFKTSTCEKDTTGLILESSLIHINCLLLVISIIVLFMIFYLNKFKLDKKLGYICAGMYGLILFIGISFEGYGKSTLNHNERLNS